MSQQAKRLRCLSVAVVLAALSLFQLAGCYLGSQRVTYPSPHPASGERILYPGEFLTVAAQMSAGGTGFSSLCRQSRENGPTRDAVAFISEGVQLCFVSPYAGEILTCMSVFGIARHSPLKFMMYVGGVGIALIEPRATLETSEQSLTATAEIRDFPYAGGLEDAPPGAKPINPGAPHRLYSIPRQQLVFHFDRPCDPNAYYRLSVAGIAVNGHEIRVPQIDFNPYSEWRPTYVD